MTIAKRLLILLAIPLLVLAGLGVLVRGELEGIEARSRFVTENVTPSLGMVGGITRNFTELRVNIRSYLLSSSESERALARSRFDEDKLELNRLLQVYVDSLAFDQRDRRLSSEFRDSAREWITGAEAAMAEADAGNRELAVQAMNSSMAEIGTRLSEVSREWIAYNEELAKNAGSAVIEGSEGARRHMYTALGIALLFSGLLGLLTFAGSCTRSGRWKARSSPSRTATTPRPCPTPMRRTKPAGSRVPSTCSNGARRQWTTSAGSSSMPRSSSARCRVK
jgi:CHASE3 domain sensor protein